MTLINNIVGFVKKSSFTKVGKSDTYNMYVEVKDKNEHGFSEILKPMPGYKKICDVEGEPQGLYRISKSYNGKAAIYGVWGKKLYLIDNETEQARFIGEIAGSGMVTFCETPGYGEKANTHLVLCDGVHVYAVNTEISVTEQREEWQKINPIAMPNKRFTQNDEKVVPSWIAYLYGYVIMGVENSDVWYRTYRDPFNVLNDDGVPENDIFCCVPGSKMYTNIEGWFEYAAWMPDNTVIGCSNGSRLFMIGDRSFQSFAFNSGSANLPFDAIDNSNYEIGIKSKESFAQYGSSIFWLGSENLGGNAVFMADSNASPQRISTDEIEEMIAGYDKEVAYAFTMRWMSHPFYVLNFPSDNVTLAYDVKEGGWVRFGSCSEDITEGCYRYRYSTISSEDKLWLQFEGGLVEATNEKWNEHDDTPIVRKRVGGVISSEHLPFKVNKVQLITNNGEYPRMAGKPIKVSMRYSKDGAVWNGLSTRSLGGTGHYGYDTVFRLRTKATHLSIEFSCSDNVPFAIYGMQIESIKTH